MGRARKPKKPRRTSAGNISSTFGVIKVSEEMDEDDVQRNMLALTWIDDIVNDSNGSLEYENTSNGVVAVGYLDNVKIQVDVRLCAERALNLDYWEQGHVPAFVNSNEICIEMGDDYDHQVPDLDLCAALLMLLSSKGVPLSMYPSTLYKFMPFEKLKGMLADEDDTVVKNTLGAMGQLACTASLRQLKKALHQAKDESFTITALEALFYGRDINMKPYLPLLVEISNSDNTPSKVSAIEMIGLIVTPSQKEYLPILKRLIHFNDPCVFGPVLDIYIEMAQEDALQDCIHLLQHWGQIWHTFIVRKLCTIQHPMVRTFLSVRYVTNSISSKERGLIERYLNEASETQTEKAVVDYILSRSSFGTLSATSSDDDDEEFSGLGSLFG
jgi:hypothetical protein